MFGSSDIQLGYTKKPEEKSFRGVIALEVCTCVLKVVSQILESSEVAVTIVRSKFPLACFVGF